MSAVVALLATALLRAADPPPNASLPTDPGVWYADHHQAYRIDTGAHRITATLPLPGEPESLALDPRDRALWVAAHKTLSKFDTATSLVLELDLRRLAPGFEEAGHLVLNPYDGSLWLAGEKRLLHLDNQGAPLWQWSSPESIKALAAGLDETLWLLTRKQMVHLSSQGVVLSTVALKGILDEPRFLAIDNLGGSLLAADRHRLLRWTLAEPARPPIVLHESGKDRKESGDDEGEEDSASLVGLALDPLSGRAWLATKSRLLGFDRAGSLRLAAMLPAGLKNIETMAHDGATHSLWVGAKQAVVRLTEAGDLLASFPLRDEFEAMALAPFLLMPQIELLSPAAGGLTNNPVPPVRLRLSARCGGQVCDPGHDYFEGFGITATINGTMIGERFTILDREASYLSAERLLEGRNTLAAQVQDPFGHRSNEIKAEFTIDTRPPKFVTLTPADQSVLTQQPVEIRGRLDDPTATVVLEKLIELGGEILDTNPEHFAFRLPLKAGANASTLAARDPAGNESRLSLTLTYNPVSATVTNLTPGAAVATDRLFVTGTVEGPPNTGVTVNGLPATVHAGRFYLNRLPLKPGENTLTITATTLAGISATHSLRVTSTAPAPIEVEVEPESGLAPFEVSLKVSPRNGQTLALIEADFDGDGISDLATPDPALPLRYTFNTPGVYPVRVTAIDRGNPVATETLTLVVYDPAERDRFFTTLWNGMNEALTRGDTNAALPYLNASARAKYQPVFEALRPQLPEIVASYSPLTRLSVSASIGEYAVARPYQGTTRVYLIYFLQDADGVWRVDGM